MKTLPLISLVLGLAAVGTLALAVATDYWLFTVEPIIPEMFAAEGEEEVDEEELTNETVQGMDDEVLQNETNAIILPPHIRLHSGLWRVCIYYEELDYPSTCSVIGYQQTSERREGGDTTNSILRAIRPSSPVIVISLLILIAAFALSTLGNSKGNSKTIIGAVLYVIAGLTLAIGVIGYISAVNDEVAHRKKPDPNDPVGSTFHYRYGWAFFFAAASFIGSLMAAVSNITLFVKRFPNVDDMALIVPGLEKPGIGGSPSSGGIEESEGGTNNPTIIL